MPWYLRLAIGLGLMMTIAAIGPGQPPAFEPNVPRTLPPSVVSPPAPVAPVTRAGAVVPAQIDAPVSRFEPLAAFPHHTQQAVRAVVLGSAWMTRMNQSQGRFVYGFVPALRRAAEGDHDISQAWASLALAEAARFTGDEKQAAIAAQSVLTLLAATRPEPADAACRIPVRTSRSCNRVGFAGILALAIYELPTNDAALIGEAERLCNFIRKQLSPDGSIQYTDAPTDQDPAGVNDYPGLALNALAVSNRIRPAPWKVEAMTAAVKYYRTLFRTSPHPMLAATLTPAFVEHYGQNKNEEAAAAVFEMNDFLVGLQYLVSDVAHPNRAGGFHGWSDGKSTDSICGAEGGVYLRSLAAACYLSRQIPDLPRHGKYRHSIVDAIGFLTSLQYIDENTRHFDHTFAANALIGGFHNSSTDGDLRIDRSAQCVSGLLRFLAGGDDRE